jgi:peroxiredoxin
MPYLKELHNKYNDKGLVVLGVCIWDEDVNNIKNAIAEEQIVWPQLVDSEDNIWKAYGIHRVPHTIFFAPDGTILMRELRKEMMVDYVSGYLDGEFEL